VTPPLAYTTLDVSLPCYCIWVLPTSNYNQHQDWYQRWPNPRRQSLFSSQKPKHARPRTRERQRGCISRFWAEWVQVGRLSFSRAFVAILAVAEANSGSYISFLPPTCFCSVVGLGWFGPSTSVHVALLFSPALYLLIKQPNNSPLL